MSWFELIAGDQATVASSHYYHHDQSSRNTRSTTIKATGMCLGALSTAKTHQAAGGCCPVSTFESGITH